jgi:SPP1 gp7 family putative phage head morphogenesis protein
MVLDNLQKAVKEGDTFDNFKKDLEPKLDNSGYTKKDDGSSWRLKNIYQTNLQTSYNAGRYAQQMDVTDEFPYWELDAIMDKNTTDGCRSVNGVILPASDAFWQTNYPPRHFGCRSKVIAHSKPTLKLHGKSLSNPSNYKNEKPAEGFDFLPGKWMPDLNKYSKPVKNKLEKLLNE